MSGKERPKPPKVSWPRPTVIEMREGFGITISKRSVKDNRCPYCHDEDGDMDVYCRSCEARYHLECAYNMKTCTSLGCVGTLMVKGDAFDKTTTDKEHTRRLQEAANCWLERIGELEKERREKTYKLVCRMATAITIVLASMVLQHVGPDLTKEMAQAGTWAGCVYMGWMTYSLLKDE